MLHDPAKITSSVETCVAVAAVHRRLIFDIYLSVKYSDRSKTLSNKFLKLSQGPTIWCSFWLYYVSVFLPHSTLTRASSRKPAGAATGCCDSIISSLFALFAPCCPTHRLQKHSSKNTNVDSPMLGDCQMRLDSISLCAQESYNRADRRAALIFIRR